MTRTHSQNGSAFFIILIAIAMFAALSYAITQTSRTSTAMLGKEQAKMAAQELLSYTETIVKAVHRLRVAGCAETEIGFDFPDQPGWWGPNPLSPADKSCQVYDMNGGKVNPMKMSDSWFVVPPASSLYGYPTGEIFIVNIGTAAPELLFGFTDLKLEICDEINKLLGLSVGSFAEVMGTPSGNFKGTYVGLADGIGDDVGSPFAGMSTGCGYNNGWGGGTFITTLIVR